jgi:hypothetical protein
MSPKRKDSDASGSSTTGNDQSKTYTKVAKTSRQQHSWLSTKFEAVKIESGLFMVEPWEQVLAAVVFVLIVAGIYKLASIPFS